MTKPRQPLPMATASSDDGIGSSTGPGTDAVPATTAVPGTTAVPSRTDRSGDLRRIMAGGEFRRLFATRLAGQAGDGAFQAALAGYVFFNPTSATSAGSAAAAFAVLLLPYSLVGPFAGTLLDRWSRQRVLVIGNLARALLVVALAAQVLAGLEGPLFYATALLLVSLNRFVLAALPAALPRVVPSDTLITANSLTTTSGTIIALLGGGVSAGVLTVLGGGSGASAAGLLVAVVLYLLAAVVPAGLGRDRLGPERAESEPPLSAQLRRVVGDVAAGARHVADRRPAARALASIAAHRFCYGISTVATLLLYRNYFPVQAHGRPAEGLEGFAGLAVVFAVSGVGFVLGALLTPRATARVGRRRWMVGCYAVAGVVEAVFGAPYTVPAFLVAALALGFVAQAVKICTDTVVQEFTLDAYRGRVFSFYDIIFNVVFVAAAVFAAVTLPDSGKSYPVLAAVAAGYLLTAVLYHRATRDEPDLPDVPDVPDVVDG